MAVEAFAAVAAPFTSPDIFRGRDAVWFVDNESACSSLVRGASRPEDIDKVAVMSTVLNAHLEARIWYEGSIPTLTQATGSLGQA